MNLSRNSIAFKCTIIIFSLLLLSQTSLAQQEIHAKSRVKKYKIQSEILKEERVFTITLPESYDKSSEHYPLLIVLDGDDFSNPFAGMVEYYSKLGKCPELIIVGINATDRWRDYTPTHANIPDGTPVPTSGGADSFLNFIEEELIRFIESKYRVTPFHILYGHSVAGLFVTNSLFETSTGFSAFIATSPSLWWDNEFVTSKVSHYSKLTQNAPRHLYLTMGNEGATMLKPAHNFTGTLKKFSLQNVSWKFDHFDTVDHQTMPIKAFAYGLEFVFSDWQMPQELYNQGLDAITEYYARLTAKYKHKLEPPESTLNRLGYIELRKGKFKEAIAIFQLNVSKYPHSGNAYDSLGEAFLKSGDTGNAITNYKKSLELNPKNKNAQKILNEIKRTK